jgi:glycosyltransferase involved in cell wall biosynthesis
LTKLSLTIIAKNESNNLKRCLASVKHLVDEIILVDTGSTDNTKEIAQACGARVFDFAWSNDFSEARNFALQQSTGDWNLVLDADEYIINDCGKAIRQFIKGRRRIGRIKIINKFEQDGEGRESQVFISRLFPKGSFYAGRIHEQVITDLPYENTCIKVYHDGYFKKNKSGRNLKLLHAAIADNPSDSYLLFQVAKEYRMMGEHRKADDFFAKCYPLLTNEDGFRPLVVVDYLYNIIANQNLDRGLDIIMQEKNNLSDYPDFHFVSGLFFMELVFSDMHKYSSYFSYIEKSYLTCIALGETNRYHSVKGTGSFRAAYNLGVFYETAGDLVKARKYYEISGKDNYGLAVERLTKL